MQTTIEIANTRQIRISESTMSRMKKRNEVRECLGCGVKIPKGKTMTRGLCSTCSAAFYRHADDAGKLEEQLIKEGKLLPKSVCGRKPTNTFTQELADR